MAFVDYVCPICNKPVLGTNQFDWNCVEILFSHLVDWHKEELDKPKETK